MNNPSCSANEHTGQQYEENDDIGQLNGDNNIFTLSNELHPIDGPDPGNESTITSTDDQSNTSTHRITNGYTGFEKASPPHDVNKILRDFWPSQKRKFRDMPADEMRKFSHHMELPMARVKKIMRIDDDVRNQMISQDAPMVLSAACEMLVQEITLKAWQLVDEGRRKTLQKCDIAAAACRNEHYDFLIDIVPREEAKKFTVNSNEDMTSSVDTQSVQYVVADCESSGNNVYQLGNGQVLHATPIGQPITISDPNELGLPPGVQLHPI